jgi:3-O-methylgallate 3,4-dioxygenase
VIDEQTDRRIVEACRMNDAATLCSLPKARLTGGNGQGRVWIAAAGALQGLQMRLLDYIPA